MLGSNRETPLRDEACGEGRERLLPLIQLDLTSQVFKTTYYVLSPEPGTKQQRRMSFPKSLQCCSDTRTGASTIRPTSPTALTFSPPSLSIITGVFCVPTRCRP